jgi:transcriptional regulator with XRE-family HTH domain
MKKKIILKNDMQHERNRLHEVLPELIKKNKSTSSEKHLAKMLNIPYTTLRALVGEDNTNPKVDTLIPIARYFGVSIDQLIGITPTEDTNSELQWNIELYKSCLEVVYIACKHFKLEVKADDALMLTKEVYKYHLDKKVSKADQDFANWLIKQYSS